MKLYTLIASLLLAAQAHGIVIVGSGDPKTNTSAPTVPGLENCGWQYVGYWGLFTGVPLSPHYFIAASHVSGVIGWSFVFGGVEYKTIGVNVDQFSDLTLWQVDKPFPCYAERYFGNDETNKTVVMIGRGTQRGPAIMGNCPSTRISTTIIQGQHPGWIPGGSPQAVYNPAWGDRRVRVTNTVDNFHLAGWQYGLADNVLRWGTNVVKAQWGTTILTTFDGTGGYNTCQASVGDSSGAVFIKDTDGVWKLDAIISSVSGYNLNIDGRGVGGGCEVTTPIMSATYSGRLNYRINWIDNIILNDK